MGEDDDTAAQGCDHDDASICEHARARLAEDLTDSYVELARSLWAEVGAVEGERRHRDVAIDVEALIAFSATLADADPDLDDRVAQWCAEHARYISTTRLRNLQERSGGRRDPGVARAFGGMRTTELDLSRASLLALRLRAAFGTGARAEVMGYLIASQGVGVTSAALRDECGFGLSTIEDALRSLVAARFVGRGAFSARVTYVLERSHLILRLFDPRPRRYVRWRSLFAMLGILLDRLPRARSDDLGEMIDIMAALDRACPLAGIQSPRGERSLEWRVVSSWARDCAAALAAGAHPVFGAR